VDSVNDAEICESVMSVLTYMEGEIVGLINVQLNSIKTDEVNNVRIENRAQSKS